MDIQQQLVASRSKTSGGGNPCRYITVHETANLNAGANAQAHANLQSRGNVRSASWHYSVDELEILQSFPDDIQCWHAGDGGGAGNMQSIGIEICVNSDGNFDGAVANAAFLVRTLMARHGIPIGNVVQHNHWSGKNCPTFLRNGSRGITWNQFIAQVQGATPVTNPTPRPTPAPTAGGFTMATLPNVNLNTKSSQYNPMVERIQALITYGCDIDCGPIDGKNGAKTKRGAAAMQVKYNCGNGRGGADLVLGAKSWESMLLGKKH